MLRSYEVVTCISTCQSFDVRYIHTATKVIIDKCRVELSLFEQDTIENAFLPMKNEK